MLSERPECRKKYDSIYINSETFKTIVLKLRIIVTFGAEGILGWDIRGFWVLISFSWLGGCGCVHFVFCRLCKLYVSLENIKTLTPFYGIYSLVFTVVYVSVFFILIAF